MDEKEIVRLFLDRGFQLSKDALPLVTENPEIVLKGLDLISPRPFIITTNHVKKILNQEETPRIKTVKEYFQLNKPITIDDYFRDLLNVFDKVKTFLSENTSLDKLISINKITEKTSEFSLIGMVKEKFESYMIIEDTTGEIQIFFNDEVKSKASEVEIDDIIGVKCRRIDAKYYTSQIVFPEIPLQIDVKRSKSDSSLVFSITDTELPKEIVTDSTTTFSLPFSSNKLSFLDVNGLKILSIPKNSFKNTQDSNSLLKILKKRIISNLTVTPSSYFFIEDVPHIILSNTQPTLYKNYKGTTIISNADENKIFIINLRTREVKERALFLDKQ